MDNGLCMAKAANGSICFTSSVPHDVIGNVTAVSSDGDLVVIQKGVAYGTIGIAVDAVLLVRATFFTLRACLQQTWN
jgi:hypothetical protein